MERLPSSNKTTYDAPKEFRSYEEEERYMRARKKVESLKGFYGHLASYVVINIFILVLIAFNMDEGEHFWKFEHFFTAFFWGIGLAFHALGVFGPDLFFGKNWEERKIKEYMSNQKQNWE
ncbi:2TM domain-containing protein [Kordia zhangzhouensis]|uniref:2TM domain-containing protein n=1 Tax=Kordia zhangzhouensis TaxID=1620405 RepID=UPI0006290A79|nr:2TM domain-containing protein [Kordia zhangzhouensis]